MSGEMCWGVGGGEGSCGKRYGVLQGGIGKCDGVWGGSPIFWIFRILKILRAQPQRPKKRPPVGVVLFLGSCKRFVFSNIFWHCQLHYDELKPVNTGNDRFFNHNLTKINFKCVKSSAS